MHEESEYHSACILDMGFTGIKFRSGVHIPMGEEVILSFSVDGIDEDVLVQGSVVHTVHKDGYSEYGLEFYLTDEETDIWSHAMEIILHECDKDTGTLSYTPCQNI